MRKRKRNIAYMVLLLVICIQMIYIKAKKVEDVSKPVSIKIEDSKGNTINIPEDNLETSKDDLGHEYELICKDTVEMFLNLFHVSDNDKIGDLKDIKNLLTEDCYNHLLEKNYEFDEPNSNTKTIENIDIYNYSYDESSASLVARVRSNLVDENENIIAKNELTEYTFILIKEESGWKISFISYIKIK